MTTADSYGLRHLALAVKNVDRTLQFCQQIFWDVGDEPRAKIYSAKASVRHPRLRYVDNSKLIVKLN